MHRTHKPTRSSPRRRLAGRAWTRFGTAGAFTLVEMLAATALASLLMVALLSVIARMGRFHKLGQATPQLASQRAVAQMLRWDLLQAQGMRIQGEELVLRGYGALDPKTLSPTYKPATVTYTLLSTASGKVLVRRQVVPDPRRGSRLSVEVLCGELDSWQVQPPAARPATAKAGQDLDPVPAQVRLVLRGRDPQVGLDELLVVR